MEAELKELKKNYKKFMKLNRRKMSEETKTKVKNVKQNIKEAEKEIRKARIQLYMYS